MAAHLSQPIERAMSIRVTTAVAAVFLAATPVLASDDAKSHSQQEKFAQCSHESKGLKGEEHNRFMSECLKAHGAGKEQPAHTREARHEPGEQQNRMKSCNEEAGRKNLHGDDRRQFMSTCLKG
jgi:hypothetical protein